MRKSKDHGFISALVFLATTHFVIHVYHELLPALLPTLRSELGVNLPQISLLVSIPLLVRVLFNIPAGFASDRAGEVIIAASFISNILAAILVSTSSKFVPLLLGFCLFSMASTLFHPPSLKAASEVDASNLNLTMGAYNAGGNMGMAIGPIALGIIMPLMGWRSSFYLWIPPTLLTTVASYIYMRKAESPSSMKYSRAGVDFNSMMKTDFLLVLLIGALIEAAFLNFSTYITTYFTEVRGITPSLASIIFGAGPLAGIAGAFGGGFAGYRFGERRTITILLIMGSTLFLLIPLSPSLFIAPIYIFSRILTASIIPLQNSMVASHSDVQNRSLAYGVYFVVWSIAGAFITQITAFLVEDHGASIMFPICIALIAASAAIIQVLKSIDRKKAVNNWTATSSS
jgi:predicted MFS family arabinose efflux permease